MANVLTRVDDHGVTGSIYRFFFPVPVVCFVGALVTDVAYTASAYLMWLHFSQWLIAAGIAFGIVAGIVLLAGLVAMRGAPMGWGHFALFYVGLAIEVVNAFVHTADGWTAVVPTGRILSALGALLMVAAAVTLLRARGRSIGWRRP